MPHLRSASVALATAGLLLVGGPSTAGSSIQAEPSNRVLPLVGVRVDHGRLVDATGTATRLLGINLSGTEYECAHEAAAGPSSPVGAADGPAPSLGPGLPAGSGPPIAPIVAWHVTAVRLPLNEDCWLGINGISRRGGDAYQRAIEGYVRALNTAGLVVVLDLHWNAPGRTLAQSQQLMADADHAPAFWHSVAETFRYAPGVVFDLYNEPNLPESRLVRPPGNAWRCWLRGCTVRSPLTPGGPELKWRTAGMQALIDTVRAAGASQPIMLGGLSDANRLDGFPLASLHDHARGRDRQIVASFHAYWYAGNGTKCTTPSQPQCALTVQEQRWHQQLQPLLGRTPIVAGEFGEFDCSARYASRFMDWADQRDISYLAWAWVPASCGGYPALIRGYDGSPTPWGQGVLEHLSRVAATRP